MENRSSPSINLAKNRGEHLSERIITFALTVGRVLIIVTEAVALGAFLYRFGLDRQLVDLHDRITQEVAIVNLLKKNESVYRNLQARLALEKTTATTLRNTDTLYDDIENMIPTDMSLIQLSFDGTSIVRMEGLIPSLVSLSSFVANLKSYSAVDSVSLDKIQNKTTEGSLDVVLTIYLKQTK